MSSRTALLRHWWRNHDRAAWESVRHGESGALVLRSRDGAAYAKCVLSEQRAALESERDRIEWLAGTGIRGPRVLDWYLDDHLAVLVTSTVPGVPASQLSAGQLRQSWTSIASTVHELHSVPVQHCPFRRELRQMFVIASEVVARGAVNPDFLPVEQQSTPPGQLLARLAEQLDQRLREEQVDTVVCHGDLCLPNLMVDPDSSAFTGFIDLGRLGLADRYADLALILANARETWDSDAAANVFAESYGIVLDAARLKFYLHLDPLTW